jgi:hypothetical protein
MENYELSERDQLRSSSQLHRIKIGSKLAVLAFLLVLPLFIYPLQANEIEPDQISIHMSSSVVHHPAGKSFARNVVTGAVVDYSTAVIGPTNGGIPGTSFALSNLIPGEMSLFVGDLGDAGSGPVAFGETDSGVSYRFEGLASASDDLEFSDNGGKAFDYVPTGDAEGYDDRVTHIRIVPTGAMMPIKGRQTRFSVRYRVRVK